MFLNNNQSFLFYYYFNFYSTLNNVLNKINKTLALQGFLHEVSTGMITAKHFVTGLGLHNMVGQKSAVDIVNKLGL